MNLGKWFLSDGRWKSVRRFMTSPIFRWVGLVYEGGDPIHGWILTNAQIVAAWISFP